MQPDHRPKTSALQPGSSIHHPDLASVGKAISISTEVAHSSEIGVAGIGSVRCRAVDAPALVDVPVWAHQSRIGDVRPTSRIHVESLNTPNFACAFVMGKGPHTRALPVKCHSVG